MVQAELMMPEPRHVAQRELTPFLHLREAKMLARQRMSLLERLAERNLYLGIRERPMNRTQPQVGVVGLGHVAIVRHLVRRKDRFLVTYVLLLELVVRRVRFQSMAFF